MVRALEVQGRPALCVNPNPSEQPEILQQELYLEIVKIPNILAQFACSWKYVGFWDALKNLDSECLRLSHR